MDSSVAPHLIQHYKVLELPVGASFQEHVHGQPIFKFLPKLDRSFRILKQANLDPATAQQAPVHPLRRVQNVSSTSAPVNDMAGQNYDMKDVQNIKSEHPTTPDSTISTTQAPASMNIANFPDPSALKTHPSYEPPRVINAVTEDYVPGFIIAYRQENIFDVANDRDVLVHAVNCQGVWGMGIAYEVKKRLPHAFSVYSKRCIDVGISLIGTCLLIPPQPADYEVKDRRNSVFSPRKWIACLFTSTGYGKRNVANGNPGKDLPSQILANTRTALQDLRMQLEGFGPSNFDLDTRWKTDDEKPGNLLGVKFNSGAFGVPWGSTAVIIEEVFEGFERPLTVFDGSVPPHSQPSTSKDISKSPWVFNDGDID